MPEIDYHLELPHASYPIYIIGAGSIVKDAHLPAYKIAGFEVAGITNRTRSTADKLAKEYGIPKVFDSVDELIAGAPSKCVFDLTLPPQLFPEMLKKLPRRSCVLIQKPMGETLEEARRILDICRNRELTAAINLQLRFAPAVVVAMKMIRQGIIGELRDMEIRVNVYTPWDHFPFLKNVPRLEIMYHSIHHMDCIRYFLGNPKGIYAKTLTYPGLDLPEARSSIIMDYGEEVRANIQTNHFHRFGLKNQESYIKWEGTKGAIKAKLGLLMNYPDGVQDLFEYCLLDKAGDPGEWKEIKIDETWFPHAFIGSMGQMMSALNGDTDALKTSVEDSYHTMACAEACYISSNHGGIKPDELLEHYERTIF